MTKEPRPMAKALANMPKAQARKIIAMTLAGLLNYLEGCDTLGVIPFGMTKERYSQFKKVKIADEYPGLAMTASFNEAAAFEDLFCLHEYLSGGDPMYDMHYAALVVFVGADMTKMSERYQKRAAAILQEFGDHLSRSAKTIDGLDEPGIMAMASQDAISLGLKLPPTGYLSPLCLAINQAASHRVVLSTAIALVQSLTDLVSMGPKIPPSEAQIEEIYRLSRMPEAQKLDMERVLQDILNVARMIDPGFARECEIAILHTLVVAAGTDFALGRAGNLSDDEKAYLMRARAALVIRGNTLEPDMSHREIINWSRRTAKDFGLDEIWLSYAPPGGSNV